MVALLAVTQAAWGQVGTLLLDLPVDAGIPMAGQSHYYRLDLMSEADLVVTVRNANDSGERFQVYL